MKLKAIAAALALVFGAGAAQAGLMIEPFIGHSITGDFESGTAEADLKALQYGARLGYGMLGFAGGIEYRMGSGETDASGTKVDFTATDLAVFVSYDFPILVRAWASYAFSHKMDRETAGGDTELSGSNIIFGAGFTGLPFISINLEYQMGSFDESEQNSVTTKLSDTTDKVIMLSVSAPLGIPFL